MSIDNVQRPWQERGVLFGLIALLLLGSGFLVQRLLTASPTDTAEEATPLPPQDTVAALGRLEPAGEVINVGGPSGERISRLLVEEGDYVEQGVVLAVLESYEERLAERNYAASQLAEARSRFLAETQYGNAQVQEAETRLGQIAQPQPFEVQAQEATVRQLQAELDLAQVDLTRSQTLEREGAIARQELDQQLTEVRQRQEALNNAKAELIRLQAARRMDLTNAQAQVQSAEANVVRSQAEVQIQSANQNLQLAEAKLERTIIRAPIAGEILRIQTQAGEAIAGGQSGGSAGDASILAMGNTRQMNVVAEVYETDVGMVRLGQQATITSRNGAFDETLTGRVERIGSQIFKNNILDDDPAANADARVVEVRIRLDQSQPVRQFTNLQVDVQIDVDPSGASTAPNPSAAPSPKTLP